MKAQLAELVRPSRRTLIAIATLVLAGAAFELLPPVLMRWIVDDHLAAGRSEGLLALALLYLAAMALGQALAFVYGYLAAAVAQGLLSRLRVRLFDHLQRLPARYFDHTPLGDVISRCTADVDTLDTVFTSGIAALVANLFRLVAIAVAMIVLSPLLSLAAAVSLPPLVAITRYFQVRIRDAERAARKAVGEMNAHLQETLSGVEAIQAFGREASFVARFRQVLERALEASNRSTIYGSLYPPLTALMTYSAIAFLLWIGTREPAGAFGVTIGTLAAFALLLQRFFQPVTALGDEWQTVQSALSGAERIFEVLSLPPETPAAGSPPQRSSGIVCERVVFGYRPDAPVLHGVTLRVAAGEHVALVGRTGAGKSSLVHLLAGLYEPSQGSVLVAGRDPRALADEDRPRVFGIVPQATQIFGGTVLENLTLGDARVPQSAVHEAARITGAHAFIAALPDGYQTVLRGAGGGPGVQLSAGQQQLLTLTRALVRRPSVLLFDEATSFIDGASEAALRDALRATALATGTAVLTVAHRLATAREADRVVLMDGGRIVEEGPPVELIARGGRFAALVELEAAGWDWRAEAAAR
ncbi:MAG TPA: ABC transporter ATP-binding protein [Burkholderiales bacterium]|nr:ABC transporter ATP-binding protein [Burkholderiales bacterium]